MFRRELRIIKIKTLIIALISLGFAFDAYAATYYVKAGTPGGNGTSWAKAFNNLDSALTASSGAGPNQIWVAAGTYKPSIKFAGGYNGTESNLKTFKLPSNVAIYGGFNGTETLLSQRNRDLNPTILSGDLNGDDINSPSNTITNKSDNAWHVLTADNATNVTLDSLIVRDGYAAGPDSGTLDKQFNFITLDYTHDAGGGLLARHGSQVTLNNMRFEYNAGDRTRAILVDPNLPGNPALAAGGGAVVAEDTNTVVTVTLSSFDHNSAVKVGSSGGALIGQKDGTLTVSLSSFTNNVADRNGGAIRVKDAQPLTVNNSVFSNNNITGSTIGDESGGGIGSIDNIVKVSGSLFDSNSSNATASGGAIFFHIPFNDQEVYTLSVDNSIFNNNVGGIFGGGAISVTGFKPMVGAQATISNSLFTNNSAGDGGAIYTDSIPSVVTTSIFYNNQAFTNGGAIDGTNFGDAIFGAADLTSRSPLQISKSVFIGNSSLGGPSVQPTVDFFAVALGQVFHLPASTVKSMLPGGGAIASVLGGNLSLSNNTFLLNSAINGEGGAVLVGGSMGFAGPAPQTAVNGFNEAYVAMSKSICSGNTATLGGKNTKVEDPASLGFIPNGVYLLSDGSCP